MKASDLCRATGISYRQLDHWCRQGYLSAQGQVGNTPGSGHQREFTTTQVRKARSMKCMIDLGFEVWLAEKVAQLLIDNPECKSIHLGHGVTALIEPHNHSDKE